ncbi:peroxisomal membrane protein 13-like [Argentina anserina]|uniref:peroxisomal membrane protein 13-like n=1 Tax=Argentina anserina TaxID=57926 RepID=UPI0021765112|nr:peroxisomal membrane protein 13-like [Potentilla anserina]
MTGISGVYGGSYGGSGGLYGGGMYGNSMYAGGSGGLYVALLGSTRLGLLGCMVMESQYLIIAWKAQWMYSAVEFFSRFAILMDQNIQALHLFMTSLLQALHYNFYMFLLAWGKMNNCHSLEFISENAQLLLTVLTILCCSFLIALILNKSQGPRQRPNGKPGPGSAPGNQNYAEGLKANPSGFWEIT